MIPLSPQQITARFQQAEAAAKRGALFEAERLMAQVAQAMPKAPEPLWHLGRINLRLGRPKTAQSHLLKAFERAPKSDAVLKELANAHLRCGAAADALGCFETRIKAAPDAVAPKMDKVLALQQLGDFDAANAICKTLAKRMASDGEFYRIWFAGRRFRAADDPALRKARKLWADTRLSDQGRVHLGFALARAAEALGRDDEVFSYLNTANALQARAAPYDRAQREAAIKDLLKSAPDADPPRGTGDFAPIFITGMPRSGTTLIEQILAAHPLVRAGGEIGQARQMAHLTFGQGALAPLSALSSEDLDLFASRYAQSARETAHGDAPHITDKSIQSYLILGHIAAAMPNARIIIVRRDPRDVALSIYKNHFASGTHRYANRLEDIAHQMHGFDQAVAHWRNHVALHEISYDALIANPEAETRALIAAAGLPWDDACLDHTTSKSAVKTLSLAQVRKPIYASSSGGWRRFERALDPFVKAWDARQ